MSVGNLKDYGNKGNNFPYQLQALQLLGMSQNLFLRETQVSAASAGLLETAINTVLSNSTTKFLVSKSVVYDGTTWYAFLTLATL
jgi:hypothetical protein